MKLANGMADALNLLDKDVRALHVVVIKNRFALDILLAEKGV